jgi:hypothetical protein
MNSKSIRLGSLLLLGFAAVVVVRVCKAASDAKLAASKEAARAEKARWENEGGSPAVPAGTARQ